MWIWKGTSCYLTLFLIALLFVFLGTDAFMNYLLWNASTAEICRDVRSFVFMKCGKRGENEMSLYLLKSGGGGTSPLLITTRFSGRPFFLTANVALFPSARLRRIKMACIFEKAGGFINVYAENLRSRHVNPKIALDDWLYGATFLTVWVWYHHHWFLSEFCFFPSSMLNFTHTVSKM